MKKKNKKKPELKKKYYAKGLHGINNDRHYTTKVYIVQIYINELNMFDLN